MILINILIATVDSVFGNIMLLCSSNSLVNS